MTIRLHASGRLGASGSAGAALLAACAVPAVAQTPPVGLPDPSLVQQPQQGATPRPLPPSPTLAPAPPSVLVPVYRPAPPVELAPLRAPIGLPSETRQPLPRDGTPRAGLPRPTSDPMRIDPATDPILNLAQASSPIEAFRAAIGDAVKRNPGLGESVARREEAKAARNEARARQYPTVDLALSNFQVVSRAFSNDPQNLLERQRPRYRTDATARLQQPVFDFGAGSDRIRAGNARLAAAIADIEDSSAQIALRAIAAWYNVYGFRALVRLGEVFAAGQTDVRGKIAERIRGGVAAPGDAAQVESYIASSNAQLAEFRRSLANAEAQYTELVGQPPAPDLGRAPAPDLAVVKAATLATDAEALPLVRAARLVAEAAGQDLKAARADTLPSVNFGVDAGRYGVIETRRDYDLRANLSLNWRLFGGGAQRIDQVRARAHGADARFRRTREEARRDATIAWSDVAALEASRAAIEQNYVASRQSRDVLAERFRVARGTLFDLLGAEANYFGVAARYVQTVTELDTARYVLLARTGNLLDALAIEPSQLDPTMSERR